MQIRFTKFVQDGNVQIQPGEMLDHLPEAIAQGHVDAGNAVFVLKAEHAVLRYETAPAYPARRPQPRKATKNRSR